MAVARTLSDGTPMPIPMQAVYAACDRFEVDQLMARLASLVANFPPSGVVIDRFVCQDPDLRQRLLKTASRFLSTDADIDFRRLADVAAAADPKDLAYWATILVIDKMHNTVFRGSGYLSHQITRAAVALAYAMRSLARLQRGDEDQAFLFGLINRIGVPVLYEYSPHRYASCIASLPGTTIQLIDAERGATGTDHIAVLAAICERFHFPDWIGRAIHPQALSTPLRKSAAFASLFIHQQGYDMGMANKAPEINEKMIRGVGIFPEDMEVLVSELGESMQAFPNFAV